MKGFRTTEDDIKIKENQKNDASSNRHWINKLGYSRIK